MREKSPGLMNHTESIIAFSQLDFMGVDEQFANACLNHGDSDSFKWKDSLDQYDYKIHRIGSGCLRANNSSCGGWEFVQTDSLGKAEVVLISIEHQWLHDISGQPLSYKLVNDLYNATIDLALENSELDSQYRYLFRENSNRVEYLVSNPNYVSPT